MNRTFQVVILAGGLGTRLGELTRHIPKPLQEVAGKPFLHFQLAWISQQGYERVLLLTGYLGEMIEQVFGDGSDYGLEISYSQEPYPMGTGGALKYGHKMLEENFLLLYGDSFLPISLEKVEESFVNSKREGLLVVFDNRIEDTTVPSNVALNQSLDLVLRYAKETKAADLQFVEAGILCFNRQILDRIPAERKVSLEEEIYPELIQEGALSGFVTTQRFFDIGTPDRLSKLKEVIDDYFPNSIQG